MNDTLTCGNILLAWGIGCGNDGRSGRPRLNHRSRHGLAPQLPRPRTINHHAVQDHHEGDKPNTIGVPPAMNNRAIDEMKNPAPARDQRPQVDEQVGLLDRLREAPVQADAVRPVVEQPTT